MIFLLFYAFGFIIQLSSFPWQSYGEVGSLRCFLRTPWRRSRLALFLHRAPLHRHPLTTAPSHDQWSGVSALSKWRQPERKWRIKESARESSGANQVVSRDPEIPSTTTTNEKVKKKKWWKRNKIILKSNKTNLDKDNGRDIKGVTLYYHTIYMYADIQPFRSLVFIRFVLIFIC